MTKDFRLDQTDGSLIKSSSSGSRRTRSYRGITPVPIDVLSAEDLQNTGLDRDEPGHPDARASSISRDRR